MRLVSVSANVLVNPEMISCIEKRDLEGVSITYIWIGEKSYVLTVSFDEFYKNIQNTNDIKTFFAG